MSAEESNSHDHIPVKDTYGYDERVRAGSGKNPKITRNEIEDRYLHVSEENLILKKHLRRQEDKIKQLATKLVRLVGDKNNRDKRGDILLDDQKIRIAELELQVSTLRNKLLVSRQQLGSYTKLVPGIHKQIIKSKPLRNIHGPTFRTHSDGHTVVTDRVTQLLLEARAENQALKDRLQILHGNMSETELELAQLQEQVTMKEVERQGEMMTMRSQAELENENKKKKLADNVQMIRLQRDSKRTASWLATYEAQCRTLETNLSTANEELGRAEYQLSEVQEELRQEQHKSLGLMKQVEDYSSVSHQLKEVETRLISLQEENGILKEGHKSLVAKALENGEKIKKVELEENTYKQQVAQLENTVRAELQAKSELIATLNQEKSKCESVEQQFRELETKWEQLANNLQKAESKLEEAENKLSPRGVPELPESCEGCARLETDLNQSQWQLVQIREELTKTKNLLKTQISINREYQKEIEILSTKLEKSEVFHHDKLQEFMRILEERADQMALLEKNLESMNLRSVTPTAESFRPPPKPDPLQGVKSSGAIPDPTTPRSPRKKPAVVIIPSLPIQTPITEPISQPHPHQLNLQISNEQSRPNSSNNQEISHQTDQVFAQGSSKIVPLPESQQLQNKKISGPTSQNQQISSEPQLPSIEIYIDKFIPAKGTRHLEGLFVTWEADESARNYSPLVSNGIFNTRSKHKLRYNFPLEGIEVQLHEAVGAAHSQLLATAFIVHGTNVSVAMHSVDNESILGDLVYSCILTNVPVGFETESESPINIDSDFQNNNVEIKDKVTPTPVPKPKPRNQPQQPLLEKVPAIEPEEDPEFHEPTRSPRRDMKGLKSPQRSILRSLDSPRHEAKHVSVNALVDEREISKEILETELDVEGAAAAPTDFCPVGLVYENAAPSQVSVNELLSNIAEEPSAVSSGAHEQKRKHRRKKSKNLPNDAEDSAADRTFSVEFESGSGTSRNVSELESLEDEEYSHTIMRIEISYVLFNERCRMWNDANVKRFVVQYQFLDYPKEELQTLPSVRKPQPGHRAEFNFVKVFLIDNIHKRNLLKQMLQERTKLRFVIAGEPAKSVDDRDYEEFGLAFVCFNDMLAQNADLTEEEIDICDISNPRIRVGVMCVSVQAVEVLKTL